MLFLPLSFLSFFFMGNIPSFLLFTFLSFCDCLFIYFIKYLLSPSILYLFDFFCFILFSILNLDDELPIHLILNRLKCILVFLLINTLIIIFIFIIYFWEKRGVDSLFLCNINILRY